MNEKCKIKNQRDLNNPKIQNLQNLKISKSRSSFDTVRSCNSVILVTTTTTAPLHARPPSHNQDPQIHTTSLSPVQITRPHSHSHLSPSRDPPSRPNKHPGIPICRYILLQHHSDIESSRHIINREYCVFATGLVWKSHIPIYRYPTVQFNSGNRLKECIVNKEYCIFADRRTVTKRYAWLGDIRY